MENEWISVKDKLPKAGVPVETKIDRSGVETWKRVLKHHKGFWFLCDMGAYVSHEPTHWRKI